MKIAAAINGVLNLLFALPIYLYLAYKILHMIDATELMWFLFWAYFIIEVITAIISGVIKTLEENK